MEKTYGFLIFQAKMTRKGGHLSCVPLAGHPSFQPKLLGSYRIVSHNPDGARDDRQHDDEAEDEGDQVKARFLLVPDVHEEQKLHGKLQNRHDQDDQGVDLFAEHIVHDDGERDDRQDDRQDEADDVRL